MSSNSTGISKQTNVSSNEAGFTIIEVLIAVTLFLIVTASIYGLLAVARADRSTTSARVEIMQSVRNAINAVGRDVHNAGYGYRKYNSSLPDNQMNLLFGVPADTDTVPDKLTRIVAGNGITTNSLSGTSTDQITFIFSDDAFNPNAFGVGQPISITWIDCVSGNLLVTRNSDATALNINDVVIISDSSRSAIGMVTGKVASSTIPATPTCTSAGLAPPLSRVNFNNGDMLQINRTGADNSIKGLVAPATLQRIIIITYRVLADGTLVRTVHGGADGGATGKQDFPLAYNVEDMQVKYILKDGTETDNPTVGADGVAGTSDDTPQKYEEVRQIRLKITAQNKEKMIYVNNANGSRYEPTRVTLNSTFNARNISYMPAE